MKVLTKEAVSFATLLLIHTNESTTTLEVKELLRTLDYQATQKDVSDFMNLIFDEQSLDNGLSLELTRKTSDNGRYQIYGFGLSMIDDYGYTTDVVLKNTSDSSTSSVVSGVPILQTLVQTVIASRDPECIHYSENAMISNTTDTDKWVGYSPSQSEYQIYDKSLTRDQVRTRYASLLGIQIQKVRACRVKNYVTV